MAPAQGEPHIVYAVIRSASPAYFSSLPKATELHFPSEAALDVTIFHTMKQTIRSQLNLGKNDTIKIFLHGTEMLDDWPAEDVGLIYDTEIQVDLVKGEEEKVIEDNSGAVEKKKKKKKKKKKGKGGENFGDNSGVLNPPESVAEEVVEAVREPVAEEPDSEPVTEPDSEQITEPITEPVAEPVTEPITEPVTEPVAKIVTEASSLVPAKPPAPAPAPELIKLLSYSDVGPPTPSSYLFEIHSKKPSQKHSSLLRRMTLYKIYTKVLSKVNRRGEKWSNSQKTIFSSNLVSELNVSDEFRDTSLAKNLSVYFGSRDSRTNGACVSFEEIVTVLQAWEKEERKNYNSQNNSIDRYYIDRKEEDDDVDFEANNIMTFTLTYKNVSLEVTMSALPSPDSIVSHFINLCPPSVFLPPDIDNILTNKIQIPRCKLLSANITAANDKLSKLSQKTTMAKQLTNFYKSKKAEDIARKKEIEANTYSKVVLSSVREILRTREQVEKLKHDHNLQSQAQSRRKARKNTLVMGSLTSADDLFNKVDNDGDGCIDKEEWEVYTAQRRVILEKNNKQKNDLLNSQNRLIEQVEKAPKATREACRRLQAFHEKKVNMENMLETLKKSNLEIRKQINEVQTGLINTPIEIEHFVLTIMKLGLKEFSAMLCNVVEEETYYNNKLDNHYKAHNEDNALDVDSLAITLQRLGVEDGKFDLVQVLSYFGEKKSGGEVEEKVTTPASFVRMLQLWNESAAERLHRTLLGKEKALNTHIHGLKHTPFDNA